MLSHALQSSFNKVAGLKTYNFIKKRLWHRCFPVNIANLLRTAFFIGHLWWLLLDFLQNLLKTTLKKKKFSVEFFSEISKKSFLSLCCSVSKNNSFTDFLQFLSFFKHVRDVSRTQSSIKMEPIAKIVNGSRGVFRTKWKI